MILPPKSNLLDVVPDSLPSAQILISSLQSQIKSETCKRKQAERIISQLQEESQSAFLQEQSLNQQTQIKLDSLEVLGIQIQEQELYKKSLDLKMKDLQLKFNSLQDNVGAEIQVKEELELNLETLNSILQSKSHDKERLGIEIRILVEEKKR